MEDHTQMCHVHFAILLTSTNDCTWACSSSKTQSCLKEMAYKCNTLKLNYQVVIYELPLEQNNGNTNCTDPIYGNFTNTKTQLCPNFSTGTKNVCMYLI